MSIGRIAITGSGAEWLDNPHVKAAYLGIGEPQVEQNHVEQVPSLNKGSLS